MKPIETLSDDEFARQVQRAAALPDAPDALVRAAIALWPAAERAGLGEVARAAVRLIHAVLSFDSAAQRTPALGMRSAGSDTRHLLYSAEGRDIDLRLAAAADCYVLSGQILGPDEAGVVELAAEEGSAPYLAALDELGGFRLEGVPRGTYRLTLRMGPDRIVLPPLDVGVDG